MRELRSAYGLELTCAYMRLSSACDYLRPATHKELIMTTIPYRTALIVGAGSGISASVARGLATAGLKVGVAARNIDKLASLPTLRGVRHGQVRASRPGAEHGAGAGAKGDPRRAFRDRRRRSRRPAPGLERAAGQHARSRCDRSDLPRHLAPAA